MSQLSFPHLHDRVRKSALSLKQKGGIATVIDLTARGTNCCTRPMTDLCILSGMSKPTLQRVFDELVDLSLLTLKMVKANKTHRIVNEKMVMRLGRVLNGEPLFLPPKTLDDDGDGGNDAGEDQTPPASEAKKTKARTKKPSAAPKPQQTEARCGPVTDEDIPAHLLNDDCDGIDADGDGDSVPPAQDSVPRPNRFSSKEEALEHLGEVASRLDGDEDIRLQEPTPAPAAWSAAEGEPETMDLFGHTPAPAPAAPQVDECPAPAPAPVAPETLPPNAVPLRPAPVRRFKIGEVVERVGRGPFRSQNDERWAMSVDLYITWAEHKDGVHGNLGKSERYTYSIDVEERIRTFERLLKGGISHARIESGIRGMFNTPFNLGENKKGKRYLEVSTLCASRGAKLASYEANDPQSPEYQEAQRRAAAGSHRKHNAAGLNDPYRGKHEDAAAYARKNRSLL